MFVKICGLTTEEDALLAVAMGADALGFVFAPSERQVAVGVVSAIVKRLPPDVITVGVFKDAHPDRVIEVVHQAGLKAAQLHGAESPEDVAHVATEVRLVIKAFGANSPLLAHAAKYSSDAILVDAPVPGSGEVFDWRLVEGLPPVRRVILAGGLDPDNVVRAITTVRPWGVDASSGLETSPGHKDARKLRAFIHAVRSTESDLDDGDALYDRGPDGLFAGPYDWASDSENPS